MLIIVASGCSRSTSAPEASNSTLAVVDDYAGMSAPGREWYYSRIGTDRGAMGDGVYQVDLGGGKATVNVTSGWGGVWTSLKYNAVTNEGLDPRRILGPYVLSQYQPSVKGVRLHLLDGHGRMKIEMKSLDGIVVASDTFDLTGGETTVTLEAESTSVLKMLNWLVDGPGDAVVDRVSLVLSGPSLSTPEAAFLYSYGHLCQCYDQATGLVRDSADWPVLDYASVQTIGTFALSTAVAAELGYVGKEDAISIIRKTRATILSLPRFHGLLPHFIRNWEIVPGTEWSSLDTVIALFSQILACQAVGEDTSALETMVREIDWPDLTAGKTRPVSHGYTTTGDLLPSEWNTFGSESFLIAVAHAAATGDADIVLTRPAAPTWDGSGFNDELAALLFPMDFTDRWGNDWKQYRDSAFLKQKGFVTLSSYVEKSLFGISAGEVPEPWTVQEDKVYGAWGVGGYSPANDGSALVGYPILAPHYAALISPEHPSEFEGVFTFLIGNGIFTPLNNVESFGLDENEQVRWNSLKGSWNLSLQTLGLGRLLSGGRYRPYTALTLNVLLSAGYKALHTDTLPANVVEGTNRDAEEITSSLLP